MIRIDAHEYILHRHRMYKRKKKKAMGNGFDEILNKEIQKLKGADNSERVQNKKI